jgi:hypothetical protein
VETVEKPVFWLCAWKNACGKAKDKTGVKPGYPQRMGAVRPKAHDIGYEFSFCVAYSFIPEGPRREKAAKLAWFSKFPRAEEKRTEENESRRTNGF